MRKAIDTEGRIHFHARTKYGRLEVKDYISALIDMIVCAKNKGYSINFHLPYEIQFESHRHKSGYMFIVFVMFVGRFLPIKVFWENGNILNTKDWSLVEQCSELPHGLPLCLDIGHLMLGSKDRKEARARIESFEQEYGNDLKHLHLHVNNLVQDQHINDEEKVRKFLGEPLYNRLVSRRTYIFEEES